MNQKKFIVPWPLPWWLVFHLFSLNHTLLLSLCHCAQWRMYRTFVACYRCAPIFEAVEPLKSLCMAHGLPLKGSIKYPIIFDSCFLMLCTKFDSISYFRTSVVRCMTQLVLFTCNDCIRLNDCSQILLIEDMRKYVETCSETSCHNMT